MLEESLSYPAWGDRTVGRLVIGSSLWLVSFLLLPLLLLFGYSMAAIRQSGTGDDLAPQWSDWGTITVDGLRGIVVALVYVLVPNIVGGLVLALFFFLVVGGGVAGGQEGGVLAGMGLLTLLFGSFVVLLVELIVVLLLPAALANAAVENSIGAGFDTVAIPKLVLNAGYLTALLQLLFIGLATLVLVTLLSVTVVLPAVVLFWGGLASARVLGLAYRGAMETSAPTDATPSMTREPHTA